MDFDSARVVKLIVHRVGNRVREEGARLSSDSIDAGPDVNAILVDDYLRGTLKGGEHYVFAHESTLELNDVRRFATEALTDGKAFEEASRAIARHLYSKSIHPSVVGGDLFVVLFQVKGGTHDGEFVLGLFKTEVTERFLVVDDNASNLSLAGHSGIDPRHPQKAALIFGKDAAVIAVERGKSRTRYWLEDFLKLAPAHSEQRVATFVSALTKRASAELTTASTQTAFKASIAAHLATDEAPTISELLNVGSGFLGSEAVETIADEIATDLGYRPDRDTKTDVARIKRSLNTMLRRTRVLPGVDLVFSKGIVPSTVDVSQPEGDDIIHVSIKLQGRS